MADGYIAGITGTFIKVDPYTQKTPKLPEPKEPKQQVAVESIVELVQRVYTDRVLTHLGHWATGSYAVHMALESFYSDVIDPLDDLVEDYQAAFGKMPKVEFKKFETEGDCLPCLKETVKWINKNRKKICRDVTALENILDEISGVYLKAIYKLENLH